MSIKDYLIENRYNIGFIENSLENVINGKDIQIKWLKHHYKNRWFADPFILNITDTSYIVLVEEWYNPIKRGRISKLTINRNSMELDDIKIILELDTHLSFPAIQRINNDIFITPENSTTRQLKRYIYNPVTDETMFFDIICNQPLTDSVFCNIQGTDYIFSTKLPDANGKDLGIYKKEIDGKYYIYETFSFQENISRMAGNVFECNGKLYRPAQVCIKSYGDAVSIQEIEFKDGKFNFKEIRRIYSPSKKYDIGFHTFNVYKGHIVVDGLGYRRPIMAHFFKYFWHLIK